MKKTILMFVAALSVLGIVALMNSNMFSTISAAANGGTVYGRLSTIKPTDAFTSNIQNGISWQALAKTNNSTYYGNQDWLMATVEPIAENVQAFSSGNVNGDGYAYYKDSNIHSIIQPLNADLASLASKDDAIIKMRHIGELPNGFPQQQAGDETKIFTLSSMELEMFLGINSFSNFETSYPYWLANQDSAYMYNSIKAFSDTSTNSSRVVKHMLNDTLSIRAFAVYDMSDFLFSVSDPVSMDSSNFYQVKEPLTVNGKASAPAMKIRLKQNAYTITNDTASDFGKLSQGQIITLKYSQATTGSDKQVVILLTKDGVFSHYQKVNVNQASGTYQLNTSHFEEGSYQAFFAVEDITANGSPIGASPFSAAASFDIVPLPSQINFTEDPKTPNTSAFEYSKNVSVGDELGNITYQNGADLLDFQLSDDTASSGFYQNLDFKRNESGEIVRNLDGFPTLIVKNQDLNAGTYKFRVLISTDSLPSSYDVISEDLTITVMKTEQSSLAFYEDDIFSRKITAVAKDKMDAPFTVYVKGGETSISDDMISYVVKNDPNNILTSCVGNGSSAQVTLSQNVGTAIITAKKKGNSNYKDVSSDLSITTSINSNQPIITASKTSNHAQYISGTKYNENVEVTFSYPDDYSGTLPLKLKERSNTTYNTPWNIISASTIPSSHTITLNLGSEDWIYKEYELYFDGYEDQAVYFIVDISNETPIIHNLQDDASYTNKIQVNLNLYPDRVPSENPCTATLNGNPYTSLTNIGNGSHRFIITDAYGNTNTYDFTVVLSGAQGKFKQSKTLIYDDASTDKTINDKIVGNLTITSGEPPYTFRTKNSATSNYFRIDESGIVYIVNGVSLAAGFYPVTFTVTDESLVTNDISGQIEVGKGKQSDFRFVDETAQTLPHHDGVYDTFQEVYGKNKMVQLNVLGNKGKVTYELKDQAVNEEGNIIDLSDVINVDFDSGELAIKNASLANQLGKVIVTATSSATSNYESNAIELPIDIMKADQKDFAFKYVNKTVQAGTGSFKPEFVHGLSNGDVVLTSTDAMVTVTGVNHDTFAYDVDDQSDIVLKAQKMGDRNYEDSSIAQMMLHVLPKGETLFDVNVKAQNNKVYYGDTSAQFIPVNPEANAVYTYRSLDPSIADMLGSDTFIPKKAGTVSFEITKRIPGENDIKILKNVVIYPKPITITIQDKEMLKGESVPAFTFKVSANDLVGMDTITNIMMTCKDSTSSSVDDTTPIGTYTIKGSYTKSDYPNYDIDFKHGLLTIKQDTPVSIWYEILGTLGDEGWYISDVDVALTSAAKDKDYTQISTDQLVWGEKFTIFKEDRNEFTAYFRKVSNAISAGIDGEVKIDKTKPKITSIKAENANNAFEDLLNRITFYTFFKPGTDILIQGDDSNGSAKVSGVKEAAYSIQQLDKDNKPIANVKSGIITADSSGLMKVTMDDVGTYQVCALLKDHAGNEMEKEQCVQVSIKDPKKDFDSNDDGCPDLNVTLGNGSPLLNVDKNLDGIPELNIDSNGGGKADINIDTDRDGRPDVNLVILTNWKPAICTTELEYNYGYQPDIEAKINIAKDNKKAELNIDWDGDMKADFNIDTNHDGKADVNIGKIHTWEPEQDYQYVGFDYDTIKKNSVIPTLNIDTDGDGLPDVNLDMNGDGIPELNIDNTGDMKPDIDIDSDGDGIKDINMDENGDGKADKNITTIKEWKPEKNCEKDGFSYDTMGNLVPDPQSDYNDELDTLVHDETQIEVTTKGNKHFKSSMKLIVDDITNIIGNEDYQKIMKDTASNQEVKKVFNARLIEDNVVIQPDGTIEVKIPISDELKKIKNLSILLEKEDGSYEKVYFKITNNYYVFTTDYLGKISIVGDRENSADKVDESETSVKGAYKNHVYGGAGSNTGDGTNIRYLWMLIIISFGILILLIKKKNCKE